MEVIKTDEHIIIKNGNYTAVGPRHVPEEKIEALADVYEVLIRIGMKEKRRQDERAGNRGQI